MEAREHRAVRPKIIARLADPEQRRELRVARSWGYTLGAWRKLSEDDRDLLLAEDELVCSRCGNLRSICSDPAIDWHPHISTCYSAASVEWGSRRIREKHKRAADPRSDSLHPLDGVNVWATDVEFDDGGAFDFGASEPLGDQVHHDGD